MVKPSPVHLEGNSYSQDKNDAEKIISPRGAGS